MKEGNRPWGFGMGSEDMNLVTTQRMETALNSQRVYQTAEQLHQQYRCSPSPVVGNQRRGDSGPRKTARPAVSGFAEPGKLYERERFFGRGGIYGPADNNGGGLPMRAMVGRNTGNRSEWGAVAGDGGGSVGEGSEEEDEDDDEDEVDGDGEMEGEVDGMVSGQDSVENNTANGNTSNPNLEGFQKGLDRDGGIPKTAMQNQHQHPSLGMFLSPPYMGSFAAHAGGPPSMLDATSAATSGQNGGSGAGVPVSGGFYRDGLVKEAAMPRDSSNSSVTVNTSPSLHEHHQARIPHGTAMHSEGPIAVGSVQETDHYYTQLLHSSGPLAQKDPGVDEGSAYGEKKGMVGSVELTESSLRNILSDPFTGALMDDASILSCGHSFGSGGLQRVLEERACITCGQPVTNDSIAPNHALRAAVQAYRREEEFQSMSSKSAKRRRDKFEQDKVGFSDPMSMDCSRGKGVQFPFVVNDRVIIKGNKRTPERFVGREAVITSQCLNGWYVVKTLDNAETVKLQYRSLLKVGEHQSSNEISHKGLGPSWL